MKTNTDILRLRGNIGKLLIFAVILVIMIAAFMPLSNSVVYGDSSTSDGPVTTTTWIVKFIDIDGKVLKVETVDDHGDATPPNIPAKKGYKFLGWDNWYVGVTSDRTVQAVYDLVMTTDKETKGMLGDADTALPPDLIPVTSNGDVFAADTADTSEEAISDPDPEVISSTPTPTTVGEEPQETMNPTTVVLIVLAALVALSVLGYFVVMFLKKRRKAEQAS